MSEQPTLRSVIEEAITSYCSDYGFGIPNGFVYCVSRITNEGYSVLTLGAQEGQHTSTSLGLTAYLQTKFDVEAVSELEAPID